MTQETRIGGTSGFTDLGKRTIVSGETSAIPTIPTIEQDIASLPNVIYLDEAWQQSHREDDEHYPPHIVVPCLLLVSTALWAFIILGLWSLWSCTT